MDKNKKYIVFFYILIGMLILYFIFAPLYEGQKTLEVEPQLIAKLEVLNPLQEFKLVNTKTIRRAGAIYIIRYYQTEIGIEQVYKHYKDSLEQNGWKFIRADKLTKNGVYLGGMNYVFKQDKFTAEITYEGESDEFVLSLSWIY